MDSIKYYVVQVEDCFYQKKIDIPIFTNDEEQAFAFTSIVAAHQLAAEISGSVLARAVSYEELEELSEQQRLEYEALSKKEQDRIKCFLTELTITSFNLF
ncbi:hypothetical protein ACIQZG_19440 [Lysinibacillus sp. NPDC096418]|uniref:hypothetical protein n=1 Tax=Lysinibacillus sp. NPDC096418 TaxID=3364138 RepID=UPI0037F66A17